MSKIYVNLEKLNKIIGTMAYGRNYEYLNELESGGTQLYKDSSLISHLSGKEILSNNKEEEVLKILTKKPYKRKIIVSDEKLLILTKALFEVETRQTSSTSICRYCPIKSICQEKGENISRNINHISYDRCKKHLMGFMKDKNDTPKQGDKVRIKINNTYDAMKFSGEEGIVLEAPTKPEPQAKKYLIGFHTEDKRGHSDGGKSNYRTTKYMNNCWWYRSQYIEVIEPNKEATNE